MDIGENEECPGDSEGDKVICDVLGCFEEVVWQAKNGKRLCSKCLRKLRVKELMD
jgi:hypothetical protein